MAELFKASEILEIAMQVEKNGEIFYRQVAKKIRDEKLRELLDYLADEDAKHRRIFESMLSTLPHDEPMERYPGEYAAYLTAYADKLIFTKENTGKLLAGKIKSAAKAIDFGIKIEIDSILYYMGMKNFVPQSQRPVIDKIIAEEHSHYIKLVGIKNL